MLGLAIFGAFTFLSANEAIADADISVEDDAGFQVSLARPAQRIISLSPHLTEILFELGAGDLIVGTVSFSDYPIAARSIPRIGDAFSVNVESVVELAPDLIVAWQTGGANRALKKLRSLGYPIYINEAPSLESIASTVRQLARLLGDEIKG